METAEVLDLIRHHPAGKVRVAIVDIDGVLRGKIMHRDKFLSAVEKGFGFCDVVFGWDMADAAYDNVQATGWHTGYPDTAVKLDLSTFRSIPWENDLPFVLGEVVPGQGLMSDICPRGLFRKILDQAREAGFLPMMAQEFEWFNFHESPASLAAKSFRQPEPMTPGMFGYSVLRSSQESPFFNDLFDLMEKFRIPLEGLHTETGPGVYEAAIVVAQGMEAGDRAALFKTSVKEIAFRHGKMPTFMAKVSPELPGCSGHVHQSLWDPFGRFNLFHDENKPDSMSDLFRHYLAGQLHALPHLLPMWAPTVNSYKRLVEGAWAPTTLTWAIDNRTVALRALPGSPTASRLETRVVGSDVNPYLAMAACLAAGLYGIQHELPLQAPTSGNGYRDLSHGTLPKNLAEATAAMKASPLARLLFGDAFVDHFTATREWEWREFSKAVTDWETRRYFEII